MSDIVRMLDNVIICIEPGDHQFSVAPMVANYINQLQRDNARLKKELCAVARDIAESPSPAGFQEEVLLLDGTRIPFIPPLCQSRPNDD